MKSIELPLKPNATYSVRFFSWTRLSKMDCRVAGVLAIIEMRTNKSWTRRVRRYAVQELSMTEEGRRFQLTKPIADRAEDGKYFVCLNPSPRWIACTCRGHEAGRECVHVEALAELARCGHIPALPPVRPVENAVGNGKANSSS